MHSVRVVVTEQPGPSNSLPLMSTQQSFCVMPSCRGEHLEGTLPIREFCAFHYLREFDVDNANFTGKQSV